MEKRRRSNFSLFHNIYHCVKTGTRFSLRDKRLFEISEFEITRVDCTIYYTMLCLKIAGRVANSIDPDEMPDVAHLIWVYTVCSCMSDQIHTVKYNIW